MPKRARPAYFRSSPLIAFGERVRELRADRGWSQEELASRADRHPTYVSAIERGERNVTLLTIYRLAEAFGVAPGALLPHASD